MAGGDSQVTPGNCGACASLARLAPTLPLPPAHSTPCPWGVEGPDRQGGTEGQSPPCHLFGTVLGMVPHLGCLVLPHPFSPTNPSGLDDHLIPLRSNCVLGNSSGTHWGPVPQGGLGHSGGSWRTDSLSPPPVFLPVRACTGLIDNVGREPGRLHRRLSSTGPPSDTKHVPCAIL